VVARRCEIARISLGSFGERPSFGAGAARMRAVGLCQGNEVPSMDGNASPSNNCLERAVKLSSVAAGAGESLHPRLQSGVFGRPLKRGVRRHRLGCATREDNVISRQWRGLAHPNRAQDYVEHLRTVTFPALRKIHGFVDASILSRPLGAGVEFLIVTRWDSMDAIAKFAGADQKLR